MASEEDMAEGASSSTRITADLAPVASRRVLAVVAGNAQFSTLTPEERTVAHASIDARIAERVAEQRFGPTARKAGQVTVSIDDDGTLVEIALDGSRQPR